MGSNNTEPSGNQATERGAWGNQLEFFLTCVGFAVGLGNVWRFPFLTFQNGGGAFLVPYFIMLILCGVPLFFLELSYGQFSSLGPLALWTNASPLFKGIGVSLLCLCVAINLTYGVLLSTILYYLFASMAPEVPWAHCNNRWNTPYCIEAWQRSNKTFMDDFLKENNITKTDTKTPSEDYYYNEVLKISDGIDEPGTLVWQLVCCLFLTWVLTFLALIKGIGSLGKVVYFTSTFPYLMMTVMIIRGATLPGAIDGIVYYLKPDFNRLTDAKVWSDAASQIFYSLSCCSGGLIAMSSYNRFHNNVIRDTALIPLINCATSVYAGFAIFSVLGFMAHQKDVDITEVAASGPGLVFVVYPEAIAEMPASPVWAILFFLMMGTLGFSTAFSQTETMFVCIQDEFPNLLRANSTNQLVFRAVCCLLSFLLTLPMVTHGGFYLFNLVDTYCTSFPRLIIGFFQIAALVWLYGVSNFCNDVHMMVGKQPNIYLKATLVVIMPIIIIVILLFTFITFEPLTLFNGAYKYPAWGDAMAWLMVTGVVMSIPIWALVVWIRSGKCDIRQSYRCLPGWGPARPEHRRGRYSPELTGNGYDSGLAIISMEPPYPTTKTQPMGPGHKAPLATHHIPDTANGPLHEVLDHKDDSFEFRF